MRKQRTEVARQMKSNLKKRKTANQRKKAVKMKQKL